MGERDRGMALTMLAEAFGAKDLTPAKIRIYEKALQDVPVCILEPMVERAVKTRRFFPRVAELLEDAKSARVELMKALGDPGCAMCEDSKGWVAVTHADGVRLERCSCWNRIQEKRAALEMPELVSRVALPPSRDEQG